MVSFLRFALVLPALTDCRWWFESLLVHSGVSSATRRKATGADHKKSGEFPPFRAVSYGSRVSVTKVEDDASHGSPRLAKSGLALNVAGI